MFRMTLQYIDKINGTNEFYEILAKLELAENKWLFIMSLFIKAYHSSIFGETARLKILRNIKDVVEDEKAIFSFFSAR